MRSYSSLDIGALQLTDTNNSLNAVLKSVLVDGYGSKPGAGWTMPFSGTNTAVFQQGAGGNNRFFRFVDAGYLGTTNRVAFCRGYESMTAVSTGTGPFPTTGMVGSNGPVALRYATQSVVNNSRWEIYASSSYCHVLVNYDYSGDGQWEYMSFGTGISTKPGVNSSIS